MEHFCVVPPRPSVARAAGQDRMEQEAVDDGSKAACVSRWSAEYGGPRSGGQVLFNYKAGLRLQRSSSRSQRDLGGVYAWGGGRLQLPVMSELSPNALSMMGEVSRCLAK